MQVTKGKLLVILPLRFLVYLSLSLAIIFLSGFLETTKTIHTANEALFIKRHDKPAKELTAQKYMELCDSNAVQADDDVKSHYINRLESASLVPVSRMDWKRIKENLFMGRHDRLCFMKEDVAYAVSAEETSGPIVKVILQEVGSTIIPEKHPVVGVNKLAQHYEIKSFLLEIDQLSDGDSSFRLGHKPVNIGLQEWKMFTGSMPDLDYTETTFIFGNHIYSAAVKTDYQSHEEEIPGLKKQYMITGCVLLVIGLLIVFKLYRSVQGIRLIPNKLVFLLDSIIIIILAILGFMGMDHLLAEKYGTTSLAGQEGLLGVFSYVPLVLIMPIVVSWQAARSVFVNEQGILDSDLTLQSFMTWDELNRMELLDDVEFSGRRRSFKVLFLHTIDENVITIPGNMRAKAKKEIKNLLQQHVPDNRKQEMATLLSAL